MSFLNQIEKRRSIYALGKNVPVDQATIESTIKQAVRLSPSAFNSQTSRVVTLYGASHTQFWNIVLETLHKMVPADAFANTEAKINSFIAGFGTALFFEDQDVVKGLQEQFPAICRQLPSMVRAFNRDCTIRSVDSVYPEINVGASLQHYNPIVDEEVAQTYDIPANWKLRAQLVFGSIEAPAGEKTFMDDA